MKHSFLLALLSALLCGPLGADDLNQPPAVSPPPFIKIDASAIHTQIYVAPNGNDAWSGTSPDPKAGTQDGPFATLTRARDEIRKLKTQGLPPAASPSTCAKGPTRCPHRLV